MGIKIPSNQIKFNYTAGKEYIFKDTYNEYQGYYYELNNKTFAGKEFDVYASELIKIPIDSKGNNLLNPLLTSAATYLYGKISKIKNLPSDKIQSIISKGTDSITPVTRYFAKKINSNPILIKEINKEEYNKLTSNPFYQVISIEFPDGGYLVDPPTLKEADKKMPGIRTFVLYESPPD